MKIHSLAVAFVLACASIVACAQPSVQEKPPVVAQLKDVRGNVLVSRESGLGAGREGLRLALGVRVITTNKSEATVAYDNGCEVKLKENERFEVVTGKPCEVLASAPQSILSTPAGATAATATGTVAVFAATLPVLSGAAAGLAALRRWRESTPASPS